MLFNQMLDQPTLFEQDTRAALFHLVFDLMGPCTSQAERLDTEALEELVDDFIFAEAVSEVPADVAQLFLELLEHGSSLQQGFLEHIFRRHRLCEGRSLFVRRLLHFASKTESLGYVNLLARYLTFHKLPKMTGANRRPGTKARRILTFEEFAEFRKLQNSANTPVASAAKQILKDYFQIQTNE